MRKILILLAVLLSIYTVQAQDPGKNAVTQTINDSIRTNGLNRITAVTLNNVLIRIMNELMDSLQVINTINAQKGLTNGIAGLSGGLVPLSELPQFVDTLWLGSDTVYFTEHYTQHSFVLPNPSAMDTVSLSNRINQMLPIADTGSMLSVYMRYVQGVKYSDTGMMLSPYLRSYLGVKYSDTAAMLSVYARLAALADTSAVLRALIAAAGGISPPNATSHYLDGFGVYGVLSTDSVAEGSTNKYFHPSDTAGLDEAATQIALIDTAAAIRNGKVDTIYRTPGVDSIKFMINGRQHEILDSIGGPGGGSDSGFSLAYVSLAGQPLAKLVPGGTSKRIIEIDTTLADPNSMVQEYQLTNAINAINNTVSNRHDDAAADTLLTWDLFGNTQARQIQDTSTDGSVTITKTLSTPGTIIYNFHAVGASDVTQTITAGPTVTVNNGTNILQVNATSVIASLTITLPATWHSSNDLLIVFTANGTITNGTTMVTSLTIVNGLGQTLSQAVTPSGSWLAGEVLRYHLISSTIDQRVN